MKKKESHGLLLSLLLIISILCLLSVFFIGSFAGLVFDKAYYENLYEKTGTYERIEKEAALQKSDEILGFFMSKNELDSNFFTSDEISHMRDVKNFIKAAFIMYYCSLLLFLLIAVIVFFYYKSFFSILIKKSLFYSGAASVAIVILFFLFSFSSLFEYFHRIFFVSNYSFPSSSNLIRLFSGEFFYLFAKKIFLISLIKGIIAGALGGFLLFKKKRI